MKLDGFSSLFFIARSQVETKEFILVADDELAPCNHGMRPAFAVVRRKLERLINSYLSFLVLIKAIVLSW